MYSLGYTEAGYSIPWDHVGVGVQQVLGGTSCFWGGFDLVEPMRGGGGSLRWRPVIVERSACQAGCSGARRETSWSSWTSWSGSAGVVPYFGVGMQALKARLLEL